MEEQSLDRTTLATISLLEARLLRIEQILHGSSSVSAARPAGDSAVESLANLERRFAALISRFRVYADILKLYRIHPSFFQSPTPDDPAPSQLDTAALRATVLSFASSFPSTVSALTAVTSDTPVPDPKLSADLVALLPRMKGVEATQLAQEAEIGELRDRSERVVRKWYEERVVGYGSFIAEVEGRVEGVERKVRRAEALRDREAEAV
ncbi:nuclear distribution protein [Diaporthe helianthi]|uniref:Nuclear distribution protein n=1 Tax=Diaporthe helianthi TaxID=158607 RepID=A0A2P5IFB9_DIAHE|nr:nuclear distribution protein [Diaporthe helianthi]